MSSEMLDTLGDVGVFRRSFDCGNPVVSDDKFNHLVAGVIVLDDHIED